MARTAMTDRIMSVLAVGATVAGTLALAAPAAVAGPPPESITVLTTTPIHVTSSTHQHLLLSVGAIRFSSNTSHSDEHSKGTATITLSNVAGTESHAWTFNVGANSFSTDGSGSGHLKTGHQIAPFGREKLAIDATGNGVKNQCGPGNFQIIHKVAVKGPIKLVTHSSGPHKWGTVNLGAAALKGSLSGGHGADNEEACSSIPCVGGVSWIATKGPLTLSGEDTAAKGKPAKSTIDASRFVRLASGAFRLDDVHTAAPAPTFSILNGKKTLSVTTSSSGPAAGDAALSAVSHGQYQQGCATGQEKGTQWNAHYVTADLPLTFSEAIFGPLQIGSTKSATFNKTHVA